MKKKAVSLPLNYMVIAIILLITLFVILYMTTDLFKKGKSDISSRIDALGDYDGDSVANMFDKCPCGSAADDSGNKGCPEGAEIPEKREDSCLKTQK